MRIHGFRFEFAIVCWWLRFLKGCKSFARAKWGQLPPVFGGALTLSRMMHGGGVWVRSLSRSTNRWSIFLLRVSVRLELSHIFLLVHVLHHLSWCLGEGSFLEFPYVILPQENPRWRNLFTPSFDQVQRHDESISAEWRRLENWKLSISDDAFPWDERLRYIYLWKKQIHHPYV